MATHRNHDNEHIPFNRPTISGNETLMVNELYEHPAYFRQRHFQNLCYNLLAEWYSESKILLTTSCTHALELATHIVGVKGGDEVILPSFTYVSTANAIVNQGAKPVFIDIDPATLNMDLSLLKEAITDKTKAIIPVHYSGIGCNIERIREIAGDNIPVIEDAAHSFLAEHNDQKLGSIGELGCMSFDYSKNLSCGHGGMLLVNNSTYERQAEIAYEIGTDKGAFLRGEKNFFEWAASGSKYALSELNAAHLYAQLQSAEPITQRRLEAWHYYFTNLLPLAAEYELQLPSIPEGAKHNGHIFPIITSSFEERQALLTYLHRQNIEGTFHYIPLHNSTYGKRVGRFVQYDGHDKTRDVSERLVRLPLFYSITKEQQDRVIECVKSFYKG